MTQRLIHKSGGWPTPRVFETTRWGLVQRWGVERKWKVANVGTGKRKVTVDEFATGEKERPVAEGGEDLDDPSFEIRYILGEKKLKTLRGCRGAKPVTYRNDPIVKGFVRVYEQMQ